MPVPLSGERLRAAALRLLASRPYTVQRLRMALLRRAASDLEVEDLLEALQDQRLLDDAAYAAGWVESFASERGSRRIRADLRARGIDGVTITVATSELPDEAAAADDLLRRHRGRFAGLDPTVARRRALGFLQRRGFGADAAYGAIRAVLDGGRDDD
jgi:regulatory protein